MNSVNFLSHEWVWYLKSNIKLAMYMHAIRAEFLLCFLLHVLFANIHCPRIMMSCMFNGYLQTNTKLLEINEKI